MKLWDLLLTGAIAAIAVRYLYRRFTANRGCTCGSSSCCSAHNCNHLPAVKGPQAIETKPVTNETNTATPVSCSDQP